MIDTNLCLGFNLTSDRSKSKEHYYQFLSKKMTNKFYYETHRRSRRTNEYTSVRENLLLPQEVESIDYMGFHNAPLKIKMNLKITHTA